MADFVPTITAIREVLLGTIGAVRVVAPGQATEGAYEQTPEHEAARALLGPTFEVDIESSGRAKDHPGEHSNVALLDLVVRVRTVWGTDHELLDAERASARAQALGLLEDCRAALMRAGNLTTTSAAVPTGLVSGCLHRLLDHRLERSDWRGRRLSYVSRYATVLQLSQTAG